MADVKLTGNANWSTFKAGVTNGDTVYMNGFTLTIDEAITAYNNCIFTNAAGGTVSASAGGSAVLGGNYNVTLAGVTCSTTNSTALFQINAARTATLTLGTCQAGAGYAVVIQTAGGNVLTFSGCTFIGGTANSVYGMYISTSNTITFTNCTARGGSGTSASGISTGSTGTYTGTLHLSQGASSQTTASAIYPQGGGVFTLSGDVVHQGAGWTAQIDSGTITYTATSDYLWKGAAAATIVCNGNISCGTNSGQSVAYDAVTGAGSITINGTVTGPSSNYGAASGLWANTGGKIYVQNLAVGAGGTMPSLTNVCLMSNSQIVAPISGSNITLVNSASAGDYPSAANVRSGTSYAYGALTGTCAVPGASSVASGVSVDATTGTAVLTSAAAQSAIGDYMEATAQTELAAIPGTSPSIVAMLKLLYQLAKHRLTQTDA
ncbi:MAG: hypothetical protein E6R03_04545, partial [Hyphomicrobiaceae bacterium]